MLESAPVTSHDLILNATTLMLNADAVDPRLKDDEFAMVLPQKDDLAMMLPHFSEMPTKTLDRCFNVWRAHEKCDALDGVIDGVSIAPAETAVGPREALYLPAGWAHEVRSFNEGSGHMAINYWFRPPTADSFEFPYGRSSDLWSTRQLLCHGKRSSHVPASERSDELR